MRRPIMVVTGGIATGKTTVARILAGRGGGIVDCDEIGHEALDHPEVKSAIRRLFGEEVITPSGAVSRVRLGRKVFSDKRLLERLNDSIRPVLGRMIRDEVFTLRRRSPYIVLDAVLYFQYTFRFKVDIVIRTVASKETRVERLVTRDHMSEREALDRIEMQKHLEEGWARADMSVSTDIPIGRLEERVSRIRDDFLDAHGLI